MTRHPQRGRRLLLLGAAAVILSAAPVLAAPGVSAQPDAARVEPQVTVSLTTLEPVTVRPDRRLDVAGVISTDRRLVGVEVQLEVGTSPYLSRSALSDAAVDASSTVTSPVAGAVDRVGRILPGSAAFSVRIPTNALPLGPPGVYLLRLQVTAVQAGTPRTVATLDTFLPWAPPHQGVRPTRMLWVWPLVDRPRRDATGAFLDDALAAQLTPTGRLSRLLDAAAGRQVAWFVDPALVADVDAMSRPYQLAGAPRRTLPADPDARQWLTELRTATSGGDVLSVPYADPDLVGVLGAGRTGLLHAAVASGAVVMSDVVGRAARFDLAWPADGFADQATLDALPATGFRAVLLDGAALPVTTPPPWTPSGRADLVDGTLPALLTDPELDRVVNSPGVGRSSLLLSRQVFLAQTLLLTVELPSDPRLAVVSPERRWDPDPGWPGMLLDAADQASWLRPVTVEQALRRTPPTVERDQPQLPPDVARATVPTGLVDRAARTELAVRRFRAILTDPTPAKLMGQAVLSTVSTAWRHVPEAAQARLAATQSHLGSEQDKVRIITRHATLSAQSAPLPVTIRNQLDQPVRVRLEVTSADPLRLRVTTPTDVLTIDAAGSQSVSVQLDAVTTGRSDVIATLTTRGGVVYSAPVTIPVDVRAYGRVALIVFGLAAGLLLLAAGRRQLRRLRGRRSPAAAGDHG